MAWCRPGDKPLYEPMVIIILTHTCVTRPQWVKSRMKMALLQLHLRDQKLYSYYGAPYIKGLTVRMITWPLSSTRRISTANHMVEHISDNYAINFISTSATINEIVWCVPLFWNIETVPGGRLTKAYDVTIQRHHKSQRKITVTIMYNLQCMVTKCRVKFQRCPLKFHTKL